MPGVAPRERLDGIDLLRGAACLLVVAYHVGMYVLGALYHGWDAVIASMPAWWQPLFLLPRFGYLGVSLFLVLSGFCLSFPYVGESPRALPGARAFWTARARRILPPYYASLLLLWLLVSAGGPFSRATFFPIEAWDVGLHALLLHNLCPRTIWSINGAYWSLALEAQLYVALFLLLPAVQRRAWPVGVVLGALAVSTALPLLVARLWGEADAGANWAIVFESMPAHVFELVCGMVAARIVAEKRAVPRTLLWALAPLWLLAGIATSLWRVWPAPLDKIVYGISFGAIVVLGARLDLGRGRVARAMLLPGTVSYGLYLFHQPILLVAAPYLWRLELGSARLWAWSMLVGMPLLVGVGWLAHIFFERPFLRGGRFGERPTHADRRVEAMPGSS